MSGGRRGVGKSDPIDAQRIAAAVLAPRFLRESEAHDHTLDLPGAVLGTLGLQVGAAALVGVLGVALGSVLRSTAGAVGVGTALVLVLPPVLALSGPRWAERLAQIVGVRPSA